MRPPPPISQVPRFPVTGGVAVLAILVTLASNKYDIAPLTMNGPKFLTEPWRMFTSALPHGGFFHLAFNVYWLWVFGTLLEKHFGSLLFGGIVALLAAASGTAEFAIFAGGIGLSGVGYGLFGMLTVMSKRDPRFADAIDQSTITLFVAWFFLCIVLTYTNIMPIANVAHAVGAIVGAILGWLYLQRKNPAAPIAVLAVTLIAIAVGATIGRTTVNFSQDAGEDYAIAADQALDQENPQRAVVLYDQALHFRIKSPRWYYNMGVAHLRLDKPREALNYFREAVRLDPSKTDYAKALRGLEPYVDEAPASRSTNPSN